MSAQVIKGCPKDRWEQVQAIQHTPFIYIQSNGSKWAGQEEDDVSRLLEVLASEPLDVARFGREFSTVNPCMGVVNPEYTWGGKEPHFIDGPRLYSCDGVVRYFGDFAKLSHVFTIDTNDGPTIAALNAAIARNLEAQ